MGLIQSIADEFISFPKSIKDLELLEDQKTAYSPHGGFAFLNLIFQIIDCVVIPITFYYVLKEFNNDIYKYLILFATGFSSLFSWLQTLKYIISPVDKYVTFIDLILGETAIGYMIAAIFNLKITYRR
jgi:hypothetical protein